MDNWICCCCGEVIGVGEFENERQSVYTNDRPDLYTEDSKCPHCGGYEFDEAEQCHGCGGYFKSDELDEDTHCPDCQKYEKKTNKKGNEK